MRMDRLISRRFSELVEKADEIEASLRQESSRGSVIVDSGNFKKWATNVLSLLQRTFGEDSIHYQNLYEEYKAFTGFRRDFRVCRAIFLAAKEDYEGGYLFDVRALVKAEVLVDDILEQATELLQAGYKDPACVLVGVALETTLKELGIRNGIPHNKIDRMNADLCKAGIYNMAMQKQITAWAHRRNAAAHGNWDEYNDAEVEDFLRGVTRFIADFL